MAAPSDNLFIADLPAEVDQAKVETIFGAYGKVTSTKFLPGQGKNAALVRFHTMDEAKWVLENLNGNIPQGLTTPITVKYANSPGSKGGWKGEKGADRYAPYGKGAGLGAIGAKASGKGWGDEGKGSKSSIKILKKGLQVAEALPGGKWSNDAGALWIGGLPHDTTDVDLYHIFSPFGSIPSGGVRAMLHEDGSCKGFGFVNYIDPKVAQTVINTLDGTQMPDGSMLEVKQKGPSRKGGKEDGKGGKDFGGKDFGGKDYGKGKDSKGFGKKGSWW